MGCALNIEFNYENQRDWSFFEEKKRTEYLYDANGNILAKNSKTNEQSFIFEYSAVNQLKKTTIVSAPLSGSIQKIIEYKYDPVGRRIQRKVIDNIDSTKSNTKKYYYDGENILAEIDDQNNLVASYTYSPLRPDDILSANFTDYAVSPTKGGTAINEGQVLANNKNSIYYLKDHLNTVTDIVSSSGNIIQKFNYTAYGTIRNVKNSSNAEVGFDSAPVKTSFTYTGREYEPETGMYYYRARYYDPNTGRFLQLDADPGNVGDPKTFLSKYIYAANSPFMFCDPSGKSIEDFIFPMVAIYKAFTGGYGPNIQKAAIIITAAVIAFFAAPIIAVAMLGSGASTFALAIVSTVMGAAIGGVIVGLGYNAAGIGSFNEGFQVGAAVGAVAGLAGSLVLGSSMNPTPYLNDSVSKLTFGLKKSSVFPLNNASSFLLTLAVGNFVYNQVRKPCAQDESYNWKNGRCEPTSIDIPIPIPGSVIGEK